MSSLYSISTGAKNAAIKSSEFWCQLENVLYFSHLSAGTPTSMQNERQVSSYYETNNMNRMEREEMGEQIYRQDQVVDFIKWVSDCLNSAAWERQSVSEEDTLKIWKVLLAKPLFEGGR
jgi:hypothetical protein